MNTHRQPSAAAIPPLPWRRRSVAVGLVLSGALLLGNVGLAFALARADSDVSSVAKGYSLAITAVRDKSSFAPRAVVDTPSGMFVLDFGGWVKNRGRLLTVDSKTGTLRVVLKGLDRPHGLALGSDGLLYVGESTRIFRVDPASPATTRKLVVTLPAKAGEWKHPLTQFAWLSDGSMLVNNGSRTDNCAQDKGKLCAEAQGPVPAGSILRVLPGETKPTQTYVSGLRNSMGIAVHKSGTVIQAENSRDSIDNADPSLNDAALPHDELNVLTKGAVYGWPYCFDAQRNAPEFPTFDCKNDSVTPTVLLPAHSAPLGLTYWTPPGQTRELLVVALHGYRDTGHRLLGFNVDVLGRPVGEPTELVRWKGDGDAADEIPGPVGLSVARDGTLLIADDRRGMLLTLRAQ
jgi:glucose/arabinose dehydrogenase